MRISEIFDLNAGQFELDFVNIDIEKDTPLFLDPHFLGVRSDQWSVAASRTLRSFFQKFIDLVQAGNVDLARSLFNHFHEPNETCLGVSSGRPNGRAIGEIDGQKLFDSIIQSRAIRTGLVSDIEDFRIFVHGIGRDKVSDMTTNIIRKHLVDYTISQCRLWGIPLRANVPAGMYWDPVSRSWANQYSEMLVIDGRRVLLTPKAVVSYSKVYSHEKYHNDFVLSYLQREHVRQGSIFVQFRKNGSPYVTKQDLKDNVAPLNKDFLDWVRITSASLTNEEIEEYYSDISQSDIAAYLINRIQNTDSGSDHATDYHRLAVGVLEFLFYPKLCSPVVEQEINQGRKRIDIVFENAARSGILNGLHAIHNIPCPYIFVECKNYSKDVRNPEIDQLTGRFSVNTGKVWFLLCRNIDDFNLFCNRCRDSYEAGRGLILPIVDDDLIGLLRRIGQGLPNSVEDFLSQRVRKIQLR